MSKPPYKLVHWCHEPLGKLYTVKQERDARGSYRGTGVGKPRGLWVSVEGDGHYGWREWCKANNYHVDRMSYAYEVTLHEDARILRITNALELDKFTRYYHDDKSPVNKMLRPAAVYHGLCGIDTMDIDWGRVAEEYHGILIAPYLWERRLAPHCTWYYGWDCASGCIWDPVAAIKSVTLWRRPRVAKGQKPPYNRGITPQERHEGGQ